MQEANTQEKQAQNTNLSANVPAKYALLRDNLQENQDMLDHLFTDVDILRKRVFSNAQNPDIHFCLYFSDGVTDSVAISQQMLKPLILAQNLQEAPDLFTYVYESLNFVGEISKTSDVEKIVEGLTYGDSLLLVEGFSVGIIFNSKGFALRGSAEPEGEKVLTGPREGFVEGIMTNLSMLRRRMRTHQLKMKFMPMGRQTKTGICICYMDNIVNKKILNELYRRLEQIDMDGVLDGGYIQEYIAEHSPFGFHTVGTTERPDVVAGRLLEGRIALFTDGSPVVLTLPYLFVENFQSSEDYYIGNFYASYSRILRVLSFFLTITVPAAFVAIVGYHHELLPTGLMLSFTTARQNVPLPAAVEAFFMLLLFDILREAGVRTPGYVGQAVGFVGGIVIGQSAVEANLIAAPMVIVVAFAGITIIMVPRLTMASLFARYTALLFASLFGLPGLTIWLGVLMVHIFNLQSFGVPSFMPTGNLRFQEVKDTFVRAAWPKILWRVSPLGENRRRAISRREQSREGGR